MTVLPCLECEHFYVTWDRSFPRGCREYGIVSRELPSQVVFQATGLPCAAFRRSARLKRPSPRSGQAG